MHTRAPAKANFQQTRAIRSSAPKQNLRAPAMERIERRANESSAARQMTALQAQLSDTPTVRHLGVLQRRAANAAPHPRPLVQPCHTVGQRWLDVNLLKGRTRDNRTQHVATLANDYNADRKGKTRTDRINELSGLNVAILQMLDQANKADLNDYSHLRWAKKLLNAVQREHQSLVTDSLTDQDDTPPVANFDTLPKDQQTLVRRVWKNLVNSSGNIRITETETYKDTQTKAPGAFQHQGFREEALAQFARLLETQTGRTLVGQVDQDTKGQKIVTIRPGLSQATNNRPSSEFAAGPVKLDESDKLQPFDFKEFLKGVPNRKRKIENYRRQFLTVDPAAIQDPKDKAAEIYRVRLQNPKAVGIKIGNDYFRFGKGSAVNVAITRDITDAADSHLSRFIDKDKNELPVPNFVTLGHELGHAHHMMTGSSLGKLETSEKLAPTVAPGADMSDWSNLEEFANINSVENAIRGELGLKDRYGHGNQASTQAALIDPALNYFFQLTDEMPDAQKKPIEAIIYNAGKFNQKLKPQDARDTVDDAAGMFIKNLLEAFPDFTNQERAGIATDINQFRVHIGSKWPDQTAKAMPALQAGKQKIDQAKLRVQQAQQGNQQNAGGGYFGWMKLW